MSGSTHGPINVLLIEDNPGDARLIEELLAEGGGGDFAFLHATRLQTGMERIGEGGVDVVLLDLGLPDSGGLDTLTQAGAGVPEMPIVVLTGMDDEQVGMEAMLEGAQDYMVKGEIDPGRLCRALRYAIARHRMLQELRAASTIDELTGLHNRRGFLAVAGHQVQLADRGGVELLLVFADLDGLKWINDTWGHEAGDQALIEAAELLKATFRDSDIMGRLGGDEFVILMIGCPPDEAEMLIGRLLRNVRERNAADDARFELSISFGMAHYDPESPCSVEDLVRRADASMYESKRQRMRHRPSRARLVQPSPADAPMPAGPAPVGARVP